MITETKSNILDWYESRPAVLTHEFIESLEWDEIRRHPIDARLVPVLTYMRDVETLTDMYHRELLRTPTGRDPIIKRFMERWASEEAVHGQMLNRFLDECGVRGGDNWPARVRCSVSLGYRFNAFLISSLANLVGRKFTATHMTFGAIHEMTTAQAYQRLIGMAGHPVLTKLLTAIVREEAVHTQFYWRIARVELAENERAKRFARFFIEHFWNPVGQGSRPRQQTEYLVATLFGSDDGRKKLYETVTQRVQRLPGFDGLTRINEKIEKICRENLSSSACGSPGC